MNIVKAIMVVSLIQLCGSISQAARQVVKIDGSSTVFPITEAMAEEFGKVKENKKIRVTIGVSGTGGGFKKFLKNEIDINDASRTIKKEEDLKAKKNKVSYIKIPVAYDGISVVVNKENTWVDQLTVKELNNIWKPGSKIQKWSDIRKGWPDKKIVLYGPGTDSGTFDYFTHAINGKAQLSRADFTKSEDDNMLVRGISGDKYALGYFGFAYYKVNKSKVTAVKIKKGKALAHFPTMETIASGSYKPLAREVYLYINKKSLAKKHVRSFLNFYLKNSSKIVPQVGYVALPSKSYTESLTVLSNIK